MTCNTTMLARASAYDKYTLFSRAFAARGGRQSQLQLPGEWVPESHAPAVS